MKYILLFFSLLPVFTFAQVFAPSNPSSPHPQWDVTRVQVDSFDFCGKYYNLPHTCNDPEMFDCCTYTVVRLSDSTLKNSGSISCGIGILFHWEYLPSEQMAKERFEGFTHGSNYITETAKVAGKCFLLGTPAEAYRMKYKTTSGGHGHKLLTYGAVNGRWIVAYISSGTKIKKNKHIPPTIRQFISL